MGRCSGSPWCPIPWPIPPWTERSPASGSTSRWTCWASTWSACWPRAPGCGAMEFNTISEAIADIRKGKLIVVVDDKDRENEGDVVFAAAKSTPAKINFLAKHARGLICVALSSERAEELRL